MKSRNEATGQDEARQVTTSIERLSPAVVTVALADSKTGKIETLSCTPEHPLFVQGQGWVEAGSVGIGTSIVSRAGPALEVTSLTWEKNRAEELAAGTGSSFGGYTVYNLTVEGDHTFFVGINGGGTWVHNACISGSEAPTTPAEMDSLVGRSGVQSNSMPGTPGAGGYTEYDVNPGAGAADRGPGRLLQDNNTGNMYYTNTHYGDSGWPSFWRIR